MATSSNDPPAVERPPVVRFPLKFRSKEPAVRFKSRDAFDIEGVENVGERLDGAVVLDVDPRNMPEGVTLAATIETLRGLGVPVDECSRVRTGSGGEHLKMRLPDGAPRLRAKLLPWVDVKSGRGAYVVAAGSTHPDGGRYEALNDVRPEDAPFAPRALLRMLARPDPSGGAEPPGLLDGERLAAVLEALDPTEFADHDRWLELMMACRHACPEGDAEFAEWSTSDPNYAHQWDEIVARWHSVDPFREGGVTAATLYRRLIEAKQARPDDLGPRRALAVMDFAGLEPEPEPEPELAEDAGDGIGTERGRLQGLGIDDLLGLEPPEWLLEGAVPRGSLAVLYGPPKSSKTFLALDMALSAAAGEADVHGMAVRPGRALYVLAEGGAPMAGARVEAWMAARGVGAERLRGRVAVVPRAVNLGSASGVDELLEANPGPWDLVVFDTLARCMSGDENSVKDMGDAVRGCDRVREATGAAVLLVHHSGKDQAKGMRGSTALLGAVDSAIRVRRDGADISLEVEELRHGEPPPPVRLRLAPQGASAALRASTAADDFGPGARVLELAAGVEDGTPRSAFQQTVAAETGLAVTQVKKLVTAAIPRGRAAAAVLDDGSRVWLEPDPDRGPKAEVVRRSGSP